MAFQEMDREGDGERGEEAEGRLRPEDPKFEATGKTE